MERKTPIPQLFPYMRKNHSIRVDILSRQAFVSPIFKKPPIQHISKKIVKIYDPSSKNDGSEETVLPESEIYDKYKTIFNTISPELVLNAKLSTKDLHGSSTDDRITKKRKYKADDYDELSLEKLSSVQWKNSLAPILGCISSIPSAEPVTLEDDSLSVKDDSITSNGEPIDPDTGDSVDASTDLVENSHQVELEGLSESFIRNVTSILVNFTDGLDKWYLKVHDALSRVGSRRLLIEEAKCLLEEFTLLSCGMVNVPILTKLKHEIALCEEYSQLIAKKIPFIHENVAQVEPIEMEVVEYLLKEGNERLFFVKEYLYLQKVFSDASNLHHLLDEAVLESNLGKSMSLIEECDGSVIKIPNLEKLKSHVLHSLWLSDAHRFSQKPVNYSLVGDLLNKTPSDLLDHPLYSRLSKKYQSAVDWLKRVNLPKFYNIIHSDDKIKDKDKDTTQPEPCATENRKCTPEDLETIYNEYQNVDLVVPLFKTLEHVYYMWRRFQRRFKRVDSLISQDNGQNCTTECLLLLQHGEPLTKYLDLCHVLEPIKKDVEESLDYEKECRRVINHFNSWETTADSFKFKTDWGSLINFRKTARVSFKDILDTLNLVHLYNSIPDVKYSSTVEDFINGDSEKPSDTAQVPETESAEVEEKTEFSGPTETPMMEKINFSDVRNLVTRFESLKVKNWQLHRQIKDIYEIGMELINRATEVIDGISKGYKSDSVISNLILVALDTLKFGAMLDTQDSIAYTLRYCLWIKKLYSLVHKLNGLFDENVHSDVCKKYCKMFVNLGKDPDLVSFGHLLDRENMIGSYLSIMTEDSRRSNGSSEEKSEDTLPESVDRDDYSAPSISVDESVAISECMNDEESSLQVEIPTLLQRINSLTESSFVQYTTELI
ncbi:hypothetical protein BEWA_041430 [Theileria equi strain WA]|uniref:Lysine-specific demethylase-like domain-containing protein n=1 Tax=Theileria equi strain WA TaxID=1537102 RepID=L1LFR4_THEEQ|nr:hypothetical protein BEWA_041430 [Theileria equi strain WA]EKX74105.1 hypothetical protein BEWA_041430 [Theileria equi strain WA]|eukprot:XP_004833557.1 hypothetical protein BEWA_041430 [Theileria equi strain WA]